MKKENLTEQEINNLRLYISQCRINVVNLTEKLDHSRNELYHSLVRMYCIENNINIGTTIEWFPKYPKRYSYEENMFENKTEEFGESKGIVTKITYSDYTGFQIYAHNGKCTHVLGKEANVKIIHQPS